MSYNVPATYRCGEQNKKTAAKLENYMLETDHVSTFHNLRNTHLKYWIQRASLVG